MLGPSLSLVSRTRGLLAVIVAACVVNLVWISLNRAPPRSWDDAEYLADSLTPYYAVERGDLIGFLRSASRPARGVHPPMVKLVPVPMYAVFGPGTNAALYAYTALIPVFCAYLFLLGRALSQSDRTALVAVIATCLFPLTFGLSRLVMTEYGLAVATIASQYHLYMSAESRRYTGHSILAGAFIGWGLLWKTTFPVFVAGPFCYVLVRRFVRSADGRGRYAWLLTGIVALVIAGPFYLLRIRSLWSFLVFGSTPSASLEQFSQGPTLSAGTVFRYWIALANFGTSAYFLIAFACLAVLQLLRRRWPLPIRETWFIASCSLVPLAVFSFHYLKEPRHLFPAFAMFGIAFAALLSANIPKATNAVGLAVMTAVLAFPVYQLLYLSFRIPWIPSSDIRIGPLVLLAADRDSMFVRPANSTRWPVPQIVDLLAASRPATQERMPRVRIVGHIPFLDGPVLNYESLLRHRQPLVYNMLGDRSLSPTWWDFVVVMSGPVDPEYREPILEKLLEEERLPFTAFGRVALPQGGEAILYRTVPGTDLWARANGEDLITATDRRGDRLFPLTRVDWKLADGERTAIVMRDEKPIEFPYLYVPDSARFLSWEILRKSDPACQSEKYQVTVFDVHSRRGPLQKTVRVFDVPATQVREETTLELEAFRGRIVSLQLSPIGPNDSLKTCVGWSRLKLVGNRP